MGFWPYTRNVPDAPNNPSNDQPKMEINTNSTDSLINIDHYSFNITDTGGTHRKVTMSNTASPVIPVGSSLVAYTNSVAGTSPGNGGLSGLYVKNAIYDLPLYNAAAIANNISGSTSTVGGLIFKWGVKTITASIDFGTVNFAPSGGNFPGTCFNVQLTLNKTTPGVISNSPNNLVVLNTPNATGFNWSFVGTNSINQFFWFAVGV